jgi:hypothetical protein
MGAQTQGDTPSEAEHASDTGQNGRVIPFSCSTNLANDVMDGLRAAKLRAVAWDVCAYMHRKTFGNAGLHRKRRQSEVWCDFKLSTWAHEVPCDKGNLKRVIDRLEECRIIVWQGGDRASGKIGWQVDLTLWKRYGAPGGARPGAGRPRKSEFNTTTPPASEPGVYRNQNDNGNNSIRQQNLIKMTTATAHKPATDADSGAAQESGRIPKETLPIGNGAEGATAPSPSSVASALEGVSNADDSADAQTPPISRRPPTRTRPRQRKIQDPAALEAHNKRAQYMRLLIEGLSRALGGELPTPGEQRQHAGWFYDRKEGPAPIEDVVACFTVCLEDPFFEVMPPTTRQLQGRYTMWLKDGAERFTANVKAKAKRTAKANSGQSGARAGAAAPTFAPASYD